MRRITTLVAITTGIAASVSSVQAGPLKYSVLALIGRQVPGMPAGVLFTDSGFPLVNPSGTICCPIFMSGTGITTANDTGILAGPFDAYQPLILEGAPAPGLPGLALGDVRACPIDEAGRIMLVATLTGAGVTAADDRAIWTGPVASLSLFLREGSPAPGTSVNFGDFGAGGSMADYAYINGVPSVLSPLTGAGVTTANDFATFSGSPPALLAREGSPSGTGFNFLTPSICLRNSSGTVAMYTGLSGTTGNAAVWYGTPGAMSLVLRTGDPAPGIPGATIGTISAGVDLDASGRISISATLAGAVTTANDAAAWLGTPGNLAVIARKGDQAPGLDPGVVYFTLGTPHMLSTGPVTLDGQVSGPGITSGVNARCVWLGTPGNLSLFARAGQQAAGLDQGVVYNAFVGVTPDHAGRVAFNAFLTGTGVTTANDTALFASNRLGQLVCIARENTSMNLEPGVPFTPTLINSKIGNGENGKQTTFAAGYLGVGMISAAGDASIIADLDSTCRAEFTDHPGAWTIPAGAPVSFHGAVVGGGPIAFQWWHDGVPVQNGPNIAGATEPTLQIHAVSPSDAGVYKLAATNPCGTSWSNPGTLTVTSCYPNCDSSTTPPILNVADFTCLINRFNAGDSRANCDGSTTPPVLNIQDFGCFLNSFTAGCT